MLKKPRTSPAITISVVDAKAMMHNPALALAFLPESQREDADAIRGILDLAQFTANAAGRAETPPSEWKR